MISCKLSKKRVLFIILLLLFIPISLSLNYKQNNLLRVDIDKLKTSATPIYIDDSRSEYDWANAKSKGICTGEGTFNNPYIIQNKIIDGGGWENGIWIEKSNAYFILQNNQLTNCGQDHLSGGIKLDEVQNGLVSYNICFNNTGVGIILESCSNIEVINNTLRYNEESGFRARWSSHIEIKANSLFGNDNNGIELISGQYNNVKENCCENNAYVGIIISAQQVSCYHNVSLNIVKDHKTSGIMLSLIDNNWILQNDISDTGTGINLHNANNNTIKDNKICSISHNEVYQDEECSGNSINNNGCSTGEVPGGGLIDLGYLFLVYLLITASLLYINVFRKLKKSPWR